MMMTSLFFSASRPRARYAPTPIPAPGTPSLTRDTFPDWSQIADEQAFSLWLGPSAASYEWFTAELAPIAGPEFTRRLGQHLPPPRGQLRMRHPATGHELRWNRETTAADVTKASA
jgi:hypothetical protein